MFLDCEIMLVVITQINLSLLVIWHKIACNSRMCFLDIRSTGLVNYSFDG